MSGETDLALMLRTLEPERVAGDWVFVSVPQVPVGIDAAMTFREVEGWTLIVTATAARAFGLPVDAHWAWIRLNVHSALAAVGLTAAVSRALADAGIACNVVAAYHHDHLFVPQDRADAALDALRRLSRS